MFETICKLKYVDNMILLIHIAKKKSINDANPVGSAKQQHFQMLTYLTLQNPLV